jgi:hypothetical protein
MHMTNVIHIDRSMIRSEMEETLNLPPINPNNGDYETNIASCASRLLISLS